MNSNLKLILSLVALLPILVLGQNCAKAGGGASLSSQTLPEVPDDSSKDLDLNPKELAVDAPLESTKKTCADADATMQSRKVTLDFPSPAVGCQYNVNGNAAPVNQTFGATTTQMDMFQITEAEEVCAATMTTPANPNFIFTDEIVISLNSQILLTSHDFQATILKSGIFEIFDWTLLAGEPWVPGPAFAGCPGKADGVSTCSLPLRKVAGPLEVNVSPDLIKELITKDLTAPQVVLVNTTGDNNVDDCMHSGLTLEFDIQYIAKEEEVQ